MNQRPTSASNRPNIPIDPLLRTRQAPTPNPARPTSTRPAATTPAAATGQRTPAPRRTKPARGAKAASLALSTITTLGLAAAFARADGGDDTLVGSAPTIGNPVTPTAATTATTAQVPTTAATTGAATPATTATTVATAPAATGGIVDGTYLGVADSNRWGVVQVQAIYSGGSLVDVQILQYPDGDRKSISINQRALPTLINEAISAQSADVSNVSGATYTYRSYVASLQSAIDSAKAASGIA